MRPFLNEYVSVSNNSHTLFVSHYGCQTGTPILFLHGGPGGHSNPCSIIREQLFDSMQYHFIFFDQRGCGKSTPRNRLVDNTPQHTIQDIEHLRKRYRLSRMVIFGHSYGTALALLYAIRYPHRVIGCILHGVFLCDDVFPSTLLTKHPRLWRQLQSLCQHTTLDGVAQRVYEILQSSGKKTSSTRKLRFARAWCALEMCELGSSVRSTSTADAHTLALMESFYHTHTFFKCGKHLLQRCKERLQSVPCLILHGSDDVICPMHNATRLHTVLKKSSILYKIPNGTHTLRFRSSRPLVKERIHTFLQTYRV